jgi:uroporphyrin-III C-methyltransferase / precorrin-2 dehydrogenase / sirohydrochlorin ferrochelatase
MQHLPIFASLNDRPCLVVGGGHVAERRVRLLKSAGARVTVLAPQITAPLQALGDAGEITLERAAFSDQPLTPFWLVVAATDDHDVNRRVAAAAEQAQRFCNVVDEPALCTFIMPAIIDRAPVTIAIGSGGNAPVLSRWLKGVIESVLPMRVGKLAALAGHWRPQVKDAITEPSLRQRFWQQIFTGTAAEHAYAGRDEAAEQEIGRALRDFTKDGAHRHGEAWLVGAGPGSPDLITLRGRQLLAQADAVLYDRLVNPKLLEFARRDGELICVGKTAGQHSITQKQINSLLVQLVSSGKRVCRLKGGDPMIFGRAGEELEALAAAGLPFQVVPGVSAVEGCAAYAGIPLTLRGVARTVLLATGHTEIDEHRRQDLAAFRPGQTLALYMGVAGYPAISQEMIRLGHDPGTPVAVVENGTLEQQRVIRTTLRALPEACRRFAIASPALLLVGETTRNAERYGWFAPHRIEVLDEKEPHALGRAIQA